jgi:hypothetical protein
MDGHKAARGVSFLSLVGKTNLSLVGSLKEKIGMTGAALNNSKLKILKYLALIFQVTIQNVMLFFIIRPVNTINLCPLLDGKIKQARDASAPRRNEAANERQHKHKKSHDKRLLNVDR